MKIPEDHYLLYRPKYRTPCVFDLNPRGMFTARPPLLESYGYRLLVDTQHRVQLQVAWLAARDTVDPETNRRYAWVAEQGTATLDQADLALDPAALARAVPDAAICRQIVADHLKWQEGYIPAAADGATDREALARKLDAAIREGKEARRQILLDKNRNWVETALPRLVFDFRYGLYRLVDHRLYPEYCARGGKESEAALIRKMMTFYRVCEHPDDDRLAKPDGKRWNSEADIEACWIGLCGSPDEAKRVVETMAAVIRPLAEGAAA